MRLEKDLRSIIQGGDVFCTQCGTRTSDQAAYCQQCGAKLVTPALVAASDAEAVAYASARAAPASVAFGSLDRNPTDGLSKERFWGAAIGPRANFYLPRFKRLSQGESGGWNWPASLVTFYWLLHRKLYGKAVLYLVGSHIFLGLLAMLPIVLAKALGQSQSAAVESSVAGIILGWIFLYVVPGFKGNAWVFGRSNRLIAKVNAGGGSDETRLAEVARRGGASKVAAVVVAIFIGISVIGTLAAVTVPAYQDYTVRARVATAIASARVATDRFGQIYAATGEIPHANAISPAETRPVEVIDVEVSHNGFIRYTLGSPPVDGKRFLMVPQVSQQGAITGWTCYNVDVPMGLMPQACQEQLPQ